MVSIDELEDNNQGPGKLHHEFLLLSIHNIMFSIQMHWLDSRALLNDQFQEGQQEEGPQLNLLQSATNLVM